MCAGAYTQRIRIHYISTLNLYGIVIQFAPEVFSAYYWSLIIDESFMVNDWTYHSAAVTQGPLVVLRRVFT